MTTKQELLLPGVSSSSADSKNGKKTFEEIELRKLPCLQMCCWGRPGYGKYKGEMKSIHQTEVMCTDGDCPVITGTREGNRAHL